MPNEKNKKLWGLRSFFLKARLVLRPTSWAFLIAFILYSYTAARTVTFEDSGLFILSGYYWGLPHPPGYPLYTVLAHIFTFFPLSTVAFRVGLLSVLAGALSCALMYRIFLRTSSAKSLALAASLAVSFASTVWGQMIIAEVYALNMLLCLLFLNLCMFINEQKKINEKYLFWLGFVGAMALANHWPIFMLSGPAFLFYVDRRWFTKKGVLFLFAGLLFVVVPYLLMWWRSLQGPEVSFLGEINSFSNWLKYIARSYYSATDVSVLHGWRDILNFYTDFLGRLFYRDFVVLLTPLFFIGIWRSYTMENKRQFYSFLYLMCTTSFILPFRLKLEFNVLNENIYSVFWLLPFFAYGYFILHGALWVESKLAKAGCAALIFGVCGNIFFNFSENNLQADHFAEDYARVVLKDVPPNVPLVASTDSDVGPIAYTNLVLKENSTVRLYTGSGVFFKNRIIDPLSKGIERRYQATVAFVQKNAPVYSVKNINIFDGRKDLPVHSSFNGVLYKYTNYPEDKNLISNEVVALTERALNHYVENLHINNWPYHRGTLAARLCNILVLKGIENHIAFERAPVCQQILARHFAATGRREKADELFMKWIQNYKNPIVSERQQYIYHFLINRLEIINSIKGERTRQQKLIEELLPIVESTLFEYPLCDNLVYPVLNSIRGQVQLSPKAMSQLAVFAKCGNNG